jgi:hypothetical protein
MLNDALTKRQLGMLCVLIGGAGFAVILAVDLVDVGREGGIGPAQSLALLAMAVLFVLGLTLLPIKDRLA